MEKEYESCTICPRSCAVNRNRGETGFCGETASLRLSWAGLHFGEEPPVTGKNGSGTIFVTGCNLRCNFCQNFQISQEGMGTPVSLSTFTRICTALAEAGAENLNIVTGSHAIPALATALREARSCGVTLPVYWNSSAYETIEALELLQDVVTGWLPDLKTLNPLFSTSVFQAKDYPSTAKKALLWMAHRNQQVIVRHLALPGRKEDTRIVLDWFSTKLKGKALLSLMTQYTPVSAHPQSHELTEFQNRLLTEQESKELVLLLDEYGIDDGFFQELVNDTEWLPDFIRTQPFSSSLARPVWHWKEGFIHS